MKMSMSFLRLAQLTILLIVPLDAFALSPGRVHGRGQQLNSGFDGRGKASSSSPWRAAHAPPSLLAEATNNALTMSGGGESEQVRCILF